MKALIITYNRLELPVKMAIWLNERGIEPVFVDNSWNYLPLIQYYDKTPFQVVRLSKNYGHTVIWDADLLTQLKIEGNYILTDPDLDLTGIPDDFLQVMEQGLIKYPQFDKCGLSLEINDLKKKSIIDFEKHYWQYPLDDLYFNAPVDTTFALYKARYYTFNAMRTNRPYTCKHVPWYYDFDNLPEDEKYYFMNAGESSTIQWRLKQ
jgi:hypothetical protein